MKKNNKMETIIIEPIKKEFQLEASQETAFRVFTEKMDLWWPRTHHVGSTPMKESVLEPGVNGRWYSVHEDGNEVNVGHVLTWDPYALLVLAWQINGDFKYDADLISEVEVQFISEGTNRTRVKFEHRNLDRLSGGSKVIGDMDKGWGMILELYKDLINNPS
jgi:uncharacterized protein YndB with AHSA1/START domain